MKFLASTLIAFLHICFLPMLACSGEADFTLSREPGNVFSPTKQLGMRFHIAAAGGVPYFIRYPDIKTPGDYYRYPRGAANTELSSQEMDEVILALSAAVNGVLYDASIIESLAKFRYRLIQEGFDRDEYFVRYSQGDTVYVISGWTGKFLSFYRGVPGIIKYDLKGLQENVSRLAAFDIEIPQETYDKSSHDNPYFLEYVNRDKMTRIRCYHVSEEVGVDTTANSLITNPRTLIEITKFIDKEVMP